MGGPGLDNDQGYSGWAQGLLKNGGLSLDFYSVTDFPAQASLLANSDWSAVLSHPRSYWAGALAGIKAMVTKYSVCV